MAVFTNAKLFLPGEGFVPGGFRVEGGRFADIYPAGESPAGALNLQGARVIPGLVDIHTHGAAGADISDGDGEGLRRMAAHLAGAAAAVSTLPVIGIPCKGPVLDGMDALLSTVQMPSGVPVATVGIGNGANAALLAAEILAVSDEALAARLQVKRDRDAAKVLEKDAGIAAKL